MALLQSTDEFQEIVERQIGMQAADDVEFGGAFADPLCRAFVNFFEREGVSPGSPGIAAKRAKLAMGHADVGGIDVAINVVVGDIAMALFSNIVGEPTDGEKVGRAIQRHAIVEGQALAGEHLVRDGLQGSVSDGQFCHSSSLRIGCPGRAGVAK